MIQYSVVISQPDSEPVTTDEAKTHLEYSGNSKNAMITTLIATARKLCETYCGLSFVTQVRRVKLDRFPIKKLFIELPYGPVQTVTSFTYSNDAGGTTTLVEGTDFLLDKHSRIARLFPIEDGEIDTWPTDLKDIPHPITIEYQAGYDDVSYEPLPTQVKTAILMYLTKFFENRGDADETGIEMALPWNVMVILDSIKVEWNAHLE